MTRKLLTQCASLALLVAACSQGQGEEAPQKPQIRYTEYGIPHIHTNGYQTLGFAQGYAQARDNFCKIQRGMLAFDGKLSRYFGPDAVSTELIGADRSSLTNDLYFRSLNESGVIEDLVAKPAPLGPRDEVRQMVKGYVEGFNRYLDEARGLECSGAAWVRPMVELDVYRRVYAVTQRMGQVFFIDSILAARPPSASSEARLENDGLRGALALVRAFGEPTTRPGSNAIALGGDVTASGRGINVANPHLAWDADMRWWQTQLTIPGEIDVSGASLIGVPLVVMGHTSGVAWSITTAEKSIHFTAFELTLVDGSPTSYLVDGVPEEMRRRDVSIEVKRPDGTLETVTNTQWWTRYGPVLGEGSPFPAWTAGAAGEPGHAYAVLDSNANNLRMLNTLFALDHAKSTDDVLEAIRTTQGVPWWTVVAADSEGQALLSQLQVMPNVTDEHAERCNTELGRAFFAAEGIAILDGSRSECAWQTDADAVEPGIFGPGTLDNPRMPVAHSSRYLENSNDSYWMPAADVRIGGMPRIFGAEGSERELRTRALVSELEASITAKSYTRQRAADLVLSNRSYAAELAAASTVSWCRGLADGTALSSTGESVSVRDACEVLAAWDHRMDLESRGALLFSRYWSRVWSAASGAQASLWTVPFDVADPVNTPNALAVDAPFIAAALADAVLELSGAGMALDAPLGEYQYVVRGGKRIPFGGGTDELAVVNLIHAPFGAHGFSEAHQGSGYMHVVAFDGSPCPDAVTLLSYSQAEEPTSPHHADQTELYSQKTWVGERFCEADILASPALEIITLD
jgi:acyl-homoserine-lactone acylase